MIKTERKREKWDRKETQGGDKERERERERDRERERERE